MGLHGHEGSADGVGAAWASCHTGNAGLCRHFHTRIKGVDTVDGAELGSNRIIQLVVVVAFIGDAVSVQSDVAVGLYETGVYIEAGSVDDFCALTA